MPKSVGGGAYDWMATCGRERPCLTVGGGGGGGTRYEFRNELTVDKKNGGVKVSCIPCLCSFKRSDTWLLKMVMVMKILNTKLC